MRLVYVELPNDVTDSAGMLGSDMVFDVLYGKCDDETLFASQRAPSAVPLRPRQLSLRLLRCSERFEEFALEPEQSAALAENAVANGDANFQSKIDPGLCLSGETRGDDYAQRARADLIVVASLITRETNLGGLTRTCEIFHAGKLVVGSAEVLHTPTFRSLAVTAEKWMPIEVVGEPDLARYLQACKDDGYAIVGAEQTAESVSLEDFEFPAKTVVLLGKEREGMPAEYISMLDYCVEIPQFGVIRSLNVHVTGALFVWEYVRQRQLQQ